MKKAKGFQFKPFSKKQKQLLYWYADGSPHKNCDIMIADGSIRSGKTIACICSFLMWSLSAYEGENFILAGKTIGTLKKNVIGPMLQILEAWGLSYHYVRSSENYLEIGSNIYYLYDANNESSQDRLQGLTAAGAYADEVALFPRNFVEQMIGRCSVDGAKIYMNCNPENPHHYVKEELINKAKEKNIYHLHFTLDDNLTLSQEKKDMYRRMFTGVFYKRFILGEWAQTDGLVYQQFADEKENFVTEKIPSDIMYAVIGVDFGGSKSAHSFTLTGFTPGYKKVVILDEFYHNNTKKGRLTAEQLEAAFVNFVRKAKTRYKVYEAFCDSAEQTLIEGFRVAAVKNRLGIEVKNATKGPINDRIAFYNSIMSQGRFLVASHCAALIEALETAVYDDEKPVKDERLDDGSTNIDSLDSMEYATESLQNDILYLRG